MSEDIPDQACGNLAGNDFGGVVIHHDGLLDPTVVPLQPWDTLNVEVVMGNFETVLNIDKSSLPTVLSKSPSER